MTTDYHGSVADTFTSAGQMVFGSAITLETFGSGGCTFHETSFSLLFQNFQNVFRFTV